jgi:hypothetical protein
MVSYIYRGFYITETPQGVVVTTEDKPSALVLQSCKDDKAAMKWIDAERKAAAQRKEP